VQYFEKNENKKFTINMDSNQKLGFWDFLHLNKPLKILFGLLVSVVIFSIIYFIINGYKIETKYGSITPPQKEEKDVLKPVIEKDTFWKTKVVKQFQPITKIIYKKDKIKKDSSGILNPNSPNTPIINVTSNNQTGGITANEVNIGKIKKSRHLENENKKYILNFIPDKNESVKILFLVNDNEGYVFAKEIYDFLIQNNYKNVNKFITPFMSSQPVIGQYINRNEKKEVEIKIGTVEE
jgi:hypothetical protein